MQIKDILAEIEMLAPPSYQEPYDNCGVQTGNISIECTGALLSLDVTEAVLEEALTRHCNLVIAHHPLLFSGLKSITGKSYVERVVIKAIKNDITIYAAHTNMDNIQTGVNKKMADKIGLVNTGILVPVERRLLKLYTYVPKENAEQILNALYAAGAGNIGNYSECGFQSAGTGSFRPSEASQPYIGRAGGAREHIEELKLEVLLPDYIQGRVLQALKASHPYEEVAYELIRLENQNQTVGAGMVGNLKAPMPVHDFFSHIRNIFGLKALKHTAIHTDKVHRIALCGGSGSFLLKDAINCRADVFITSDFKYHQFFDAEGKIIITDIGHYESEHFTPEIFSEIINQKFPNFAVHLSEVNTNPINYYI